MTEPESITTDAPTGDGAEDRSEAPQQRSVGRLVIGVLALLLGLAMTVSAVAGVVRGKDLFMMFALWMITGALPLWGGVVALRGSKKAAGTEAAT